MNKTGSAKIKTEISLLFLFAFVAHSIMMLFFFCFDIKLMAIMNIFSVTIYFLLFIFSKKKSVSCSFLPIAVIIGAAEVILHQTFAVISLGSEVGFQYFLLMLGVIIILQSNEILKRNTKVTLCVLIILFMVLVELYAFIREPLYFPPDTAKQVLMVSVTVVSSFGILSFSFNQWNISEHYRSQIEDLLGESNIKIFQMQEKIIRNFADIIERRDGGTGEHIKRTSAYVEAIIKALVESGKYTDILTPEYQKIVISASPLHDIGKISISDIILCKKGKLTKDEFEIMKTHSGIGGNMLKELLGDLESNEYIQIATDISKYHHEKWNGNGYPEQLKGEEIPLCARIMAVADVFDALTSVRVYKEKFSLDESYRIMESEAGEQFDPVIISEFIRIRPEIAAIYNQLSE